MTLNHYPFTPGFVAHSETSRMAADALIDAEGQLADVLEAFKQAGARGLTADEAAAIVHLTRPKMENSTVAARMVRLKSDGVIYQKGERRKTSRGRLAEVWLHIDHANLADAELTAQTLRSRRYTNQETLSVVADFLAEAVQRQAFAMPLLYDNRALDLEARLRKIIKGMGK